MTILNSKAVLVALTLVLLATGSVAYGMAEARNRTDAAQVSTKEAHAEVEYAFDPNDTRKLVGHSTDVFFGRVIEQVGSETEPAIEDKSKTRRDDEPGAKVGPNGKLQTQFAVEVQENIKGKATGTVTVNQGGGYLDDGHEDHRHLELVEGDPLLVPGQEYLFVVNYEKEEGWYTVVAQPFGDDKIEDRNERAEKKDKFKKAKDEEILFDIANEDVPEKSGEPKRPVGETPAWERFPVKDKTDAVKDKIGS